MAVLLAIPRPFPACPRLHQASYSSLRSPRVSCIPVLGDLDEWLPRPSPAESSLPAVGQCSMEYRTVERSHRHWTNKGGQISRSGHRSDTADTFFVTKAREVIRLSTVERAFSHIRKVADVYRNDGADQHPSCLPRQPTRWA